MPRLSGYSELQLRAAGRSLRTGAHTRHWSQSPQHRLQQTGRVGRHSAVCTKQAWALSLGSLTGHAAVQGQG